jgi:predicted phage tail protein
VGDGVHQPEMIPLLPAPRFSNLAADFPPQLMSFTLPEVPGVKGYRGELSSDEHFAQIVAPVRSDNALIKLSGLGEGSYWLRLRAIDEHGLQGMTGVTKFVVKAHTTASALKVEIKPTSLSFVGNRITISWQADPELKYECQMSGTQNFDFPLVNIIVKENVLSIPTPERGKYAVRVRAINTEGVKGDWSDPLSFVVE